MKNQAWPLVPGDDDVWDLWKWCAWPWEKMRLALFSGSCFVPPEKAALVASEEC